MRLARSYTDYFLSSVSDFLKVDKLVILAYDIKSYSRRTNLDFGLTEAGEAIFRLLPTTICDKALIAASTPLELSKIRQARCPVI